VDPIPKIVSGLRHIARELSVHSKFIQDNYNITVPQLVCLREICDNKSISLGELTRSLHLNNSTVTGIIDRLEKRNLVRRVRQSRDRRQIHVEVTDEGKRFIKQAPKALQDHFIEQIRLMDPLEVDKILWAIGKLADMLQIASAAEQDKTPSPKE
jgi:MarR family transcriptional regulator, organic hydroperoxide resistance regulator